MMINLNNYEEYFLLYIDNELNKEDCDAVEAFALQHPQLAAELRLLQGAKLPAEDATPFTSKAALYKVADNSININNHEEYFLLYTDKELSPEQSKEVEQFVLQHPQLQDSFLLTQQATLIPELVECPDKQRLYKQPGKRIIPLYVSRMAAAAAMFGAVVLIGYLFKNNNGTPPQVAINTSQSQPAEKSSSPQEKTTILLPEKKNNNNVVIAAKEEKQHAQKQERSPKIIYNKQGLSAEQKSNNDELMVAKIEPLPQQKITPVPEDVVATSNAISKQAVALKPLEEVNEEEPESTVTYVSNDYTTVKPAVYKELNTDDDQTLYVGSLQLNKAKVNGLFKKASHLLGGKAKESNL